MTTPIHRPNESTESTLLVDGIDCLYTLDPDRGGLGEIRDASILMSADGTITWIGRATDAPSADEVIDGSGTI